MSILLTYLNFYAILRFYNPNPMNSVTDKSVKNSLSNSDIPELETIELLFFAYRDFIADPDRILAQLGFGRAHHRVLYFVNRKPGLMVADLLETLQITKQSLARVLKQLIDNGYIIQMTGETDRRQRRLYPTELGRDLILNLSMPQSRRIKNALSKLDKTDNETIRQFFRFMSEETQDNK